MTLTDGRGELYQWDTGRTLTVDDATVTQVHFQNRAYGRTIDVDVKDGTAIIPDVLLQKPGELRVFAFVTSDDGNYTKVERVFDVTRRNKPNDYVYTPTEQKSLEQLQEQINTLGTGVGLAYNAIVKRMGDLNNLKTTAKDNLVAAINEAAQSGTDISLGVTATVGQTIKVKTVDADGKPTAWEAADMASGGGDGETWELINTSVVPAETTKLTITQDLAGKPFAYYELKYVIQVAVPSDKQDATIWFSCQPQTAKNASIKINGATTNQVIVGYASSLGGFAGGGNSLTIKPDVFSYGFADTVSISKLTMYQMYASSANLYLPEGTKVSLFGRGK